MPLRLRFALLNVFVIGCAIIVLSALAYGIEWRDLGAEVDASLRSQSRNLLAIYEARASFSERARERIIPQPSVFSAPAFHVQVLDPTGAVVERTSGLGNRQLPIDARTLDRAGNNEDVLETVIVDGQPVRLLTVALVARESFLGYLQVATSLAGVDDSIELLGRTLVVAGAAVLAVTIVCSWALAAWSLRPIGRVTRAAQEISLSGRLDRRLAVPRSGDEIGRLVATVNTMLERLEVAFNVQRRFVADASHELRTPLTTIRGNLDLIKRSENTLSPEMRDALEDVVGEAERMTRLVQGLLALARADAGLVLAREEVRLDQIVRAVHRECQGVTERVSVRLGRVEPTQVMGDRDALKQLLLILVDNALKYTDSGTIMISLEHQYGKAVLAVSDTGRGIAAEDLPHIFERFYRAPTARSSGGTGLGLSIAEWIASEHGGVVRVESRLGQGALFSVQIEAVRPVPGPVVGPTETEALDPDRPTATLVQTT